MNNERRKDKGSFFGKYVKSFKHAVDGIVYAIENEMNILIMMICTFLVLIAGYLLKISIVELVCVVICIGMVMACELINSAIEACIDLVTLEDNKLAKIAKDCGSGASLILSVISLFVAGIIFIPKIIALF